MIQLNAAYGVLSDPVRRARYDALRWTGSRTHGEAARVAPTRTPSAGRASARRPPINRVTPANRAGPRYGRTLVVLALVVLLFGALVVYSAWLVAGALDDEPVQALTSHPPELQKMIDRR
jgi:curved DNA-binding protein CbpA